MATPAKLHDRPYLWYCPPLLRAIRFAPYCRQFLDLDIGLKKTRADLASVDYAREVEWHRSSRMMRGDGRLHDGQDRPAIFPAIEQFCGTGPLSASNFIKANGLLTGTPGTLRRGLVWIGSTHPADAWYVAPDPAVLPRLLSNLATFLNHRDLPVSLRASVALVRLLQIHPFQDANGRTARALFLATCLRSFGFQTALLQVLPSVWQMGGLQLHAASLRIRDDNDWDEFMELAHSSFSLAVANATELDAL